MASVSETYATVHSMVFKDALLFSLPLLQQMNGEMEETGIPR